MTDNKKIQINELKIKKAIESSLPLVITTYTLPHDMEIYMSEVLKFFLKELNQEKSFEYLSYCLSELITNAKKANTKRIYFQEKKLDIFDKEQYLEGMKTFKKDTLENIHYYLDLQRKAGLYIKFILHFQKNYIHFEVRNNSPMTVMEYKRIHDKLSRAQQYTSMDEAFNTILDDSEGAGLGLIILSLMLKKIGVTANDFIVDSTETETIISINVPLFNTEEIENYDDISQKVANTIDSLPHFPENITKINKLLNDKDVTLYSIAQQISNDITLTAELLRLVNSAAFGLSSPCQNITKAVQYLGIRGIRNLLYSIGALKALQKLTPANSNIWTHSYKTAFYAYNIARNFFSNNRTIIDDSYVCGLLHDIGRVIFDSAHPEFIQSIREKFSNTAIPDFVIEKIFDGINHAEIGSFIAEKWNLPVTVIQSIKYHHEPDNAPSEYKNISKVIYFANMITNYQEETVDYYQFDEEILLSFNITNETQLKTISDKLLNAFQKK